MANSNDKNIEINVRTQLIEIEKADKSPEVSAYAFSSEGKFLASAPIDPKGTVTLRIPKVDRAAIIRVVVGPKTEKDAAEFPDLVRRGAQEKHLRIDPKIGRADIDFLVFPNIWRCWLLGICFVRGTLNKRVLVGGQYVNFPVCNSTVEIYEVDPIWIIISKLPDPVLAHLRDIIRDPRPIPSPIPGPGPDPATFARGAMLQQITAQEHRFDADVAAELKELAKAQDLRLAAQIGSKLQFQQALVDHALLIRPLLCILYPHFVTKQLVGTAQTDECGHFQTFFFKGCNNPDTPDLYFKAKQRLFGFFDVYIYAPTPIACYTWWNYSCGTEVTLYTSSPWAHTCSPCPPVIGPGGHNRWVAFMAIGAYGLNNIYGTAQDLVGSTNSTNIGLTQSGAPWGGMLLPRLEFSNDLEAAGVRYYQVSWRKGSTGNFLPLTGQVHHYYRHDITTPTGNMPAWTPEILGPINVDDGAGHQIPNMFKIPFPSVAPAGVWDVPPDINEIKEHFASAKFPSQDIAPGMSYDGNGILVGADTSGKYEIKVDLFDSTGHPINIGTVGVVYAVPTDPDSGGVINTEDASALGLVNGSSMIITLHVDNNRCFAAIDPPTVGSASADDCCGVLAYHPGDSVTMTWRAEHPHNFANYSFTVVRGIRGVISESGSVSSSTSPETRTVEFMMTENPGPGCSPAGCVVAGFSENLYVDSLATDGWTNELGYDASAVRAFVLSRH